MDYMAKRKIACNNLFSSFRPDFSGCRNKREAQTILSLSRDGWFSKDIAIEIGKTAKAVQKFWRRYDFPVLHNFSPPRREERPGWGGGVANKKGYLYSRTPGHPNASKHGEYVAVHRLVMEESLGRMLLPSEVVDHIDGDTLNNSPDNLRVFESNAEHLRVTLAGKCPNWSPAGWSQIVEGASRGRARLAALYRGKPPSRAE